MNIMGKVLNRTVLSILTGFFVFVSVVNGQSALDGKIRQNNARNKIKNQESWDYRYEGKSPGRTGSRTSVTTYTASGNIAGVVAYNAKGDVQHVEKYSYDAAGRRTEYTRMSGENAQKPSYQKLSVYDQKGNVTEEKGFDGVDNFRNVYTYNAAGVLSEIKYYVNNALKEQRKFSGAATLTNVEIFNGSGVLMSKLVLKYDSNGNLTEETVYGINQAELEKKRYNYDQNSNVTAEYNYKLEKITLTTTYNYNAAGDLVSVYEQSTSSAQFLKKSLTYDSLGNLKELKWRRNAEDVFNTMVYTYDSRGVCTTVETFYPQTDYRVLTKYVYAYF